ncbi:MAG: hypothetical protein K2N82_04195 [Lachnospiraceae bacterium]|nr:hypothetical protein [Lachnospiraceae bacterium]
MIIPFEREYREKWIKKIIGEVVEKRGFVYTGHNRDGYVHGYSFKCTKGDLRQDIEVSIIDNTIRMELNTNAYGQIWVDACDLMESNLEPDETGFVEFKNESEYKEILYSFCKILNQKGFAVLEEKSKPTTEARPKKETYWKLYMEHDELNREYRKKYGLEDTESSLKCMQRIGDIILESTDQEFAEVEEMLIGLAAVYGDQLIKKMGGKWVWSEVHNSSGIDEMKNGSYANPLADTIFYWRRGEEYIDTLIRAFKMGPFDVVT